MLDWAVQTLRYYVLLGLIISFVLPWQCYALRHPKQEQRQANIKVLFQRVLHPKAPKATHSTQSGDSQDTKDLLRSELRQVAWLCAQ